MFPSLRLLLALGVLTLLSPGPQEVTIEHSAGLGYELRATRTMSMRTGEASMRVDGQAFPAELVKGSVPDRDDVETAVLRDRVRMVAEGRPVDVVREFVELRIERSVAGATTVQTGVLQGAKLVLEHGEDGEVEARFEDGEERTVEDVFLAGHRLEHAIHRFLPEEAVEVGDSWKPDDDAVKALLLSPGPPHYANSPTAELPVLLADAAEFTAEMTLADRVTLDGVACHKLELRVALQADLDELPAEFSSSEQGMQGSVRVASEHRGELWIAVERRFPVKLEIESEWTFDIDMHVDQSGARVDVEMELIANNTSSREWEVLD